MAVHRHECIFFFKRLLAIIKDTIRVISLISQHRLLQTGPFFTALCVNYSCVLLLKHATSFLFHENNACHTSPKEPGAY